MVTLVDLAVVREALEAIPDPEIPVLTIGDLGLVRTVTEVDGVVAVEITPTYSGCPAMDLITEQVTEVLDGFDLPSTTVSLVHSPAWTTDWMTADAKRRLNEYGIAPPGRLGKVDVVICPQCGSDQTEVVSLFGSTACKALRRCTACLEPFDHFKVH